MIRSLGKTQNTLRSANCTPLEGVSITRQRLTSRKKVMKRRERTFPGPMMSVWWSRIWIAQQQTWKAKVNHTQDMW